MSSPELTGGAGFSFEDSVAAYYLSHLAAGTTSRALDGAVVVQVAQQREPFGQPLDDVIVDGVELPTHSTRTLSLQVKRTLRINANQSNADFRAIVRRGWETIKADGFRPGLDRVGAAFAEMNAQDYRDARTLLEWARASATPEDFHARRDAASITQRAIWAAFDRVLRDQSASTTPDEDLHTLLSHFVLLRFDFLLPGASDDAQAIAHLQQALAPGAADRAASLWNELRLLARLGAGAARQHTRASLIRALAGYRFYGSPAAAADLARLRAANAAWQRDLRSEIGGIHVDRRGLLDDIDRSRASHRLTLLRGEPGTGKSVVFRDYMVRRAGDSPALLLAASRINGRDWLSHATALQIATPSLKDLLVEIDASGTSTLFIDGLDRLGSDERGVVSDVLALLAVDSDLAHWTVLATARDTALESLFNWLPSAFATAGRWDAVDVGNLDDTECSWLAARVPALRPLLFAESSVTAITRRPFFASILCRSVRTSVSAGPLPHTELDLIQVWWRHGGSYDANASEVLLRQQALVDLAQKGAPTLGQKVRLDALNPATLNVLEHLLADGIVRESSAGHVVQFAHDIFFEWSYLQQLVRADDRWLQTLTDAGELPALGRPVELLSQRAYNDFSAWREILAALQQSNARSQWLRAWLLGPLGSARFGSHSSELATLLQADNFALLGRLLVWMQAEKTRPNPLVLTLPSFVPNVSDDERLQMADRLGWPSDVNAWARLILWLLPQIETLPVARLEEMVTIFETWRNMVGNEPDAISDRIVPQALSWLETIEVEARAPIDRQIAIIREPMSAPRVPTSKQEALRAIVLRAAVAYPDLVRGYLQRVAALPRPCEIFGEVIAFSPTLARTHPAELAAITRAALLAELPDAAVARLRAESEIHLDALRRARETPEEERTNGQRAVMSQPTFLESPWDGDWDSLAVDDPHAMFSSPWAGQLPFASLFEHAPSEARALVRSIGNHAIEAWRQLHAHGQLFGTPVPIRVLLPWGEQVFWGGYEQYSGFRGHYGPSALGAAWMALEAWGLREMDGRRPAADVIQDVLEGQSHVAALGIAVHLALRAGEGSDVAVALASCQRLWPLDIRRLVVEPALATYPTAASASRASSDASLRQYDIRALLPLILLSGNATRREAIQAALAQFSHSLPFEYEEQRDDATARAQLEEDAARWALLGQPERYVVHQSEVPGQVLIETRPLEQGDPMAHEAHERLQQVYAPHRLLKWADNSFTRQQVDPSLPLNTAVQEAIEISGRIQSLDLYDVETGVGHGAIAAAAAVVARFAPDSPHGAWVDAVLRRYLGAADQPGRRPARVAIPWHPKKFIAFALAGRLRHGTATAEDRRNLLSLIGHSLDSVRVPALEALAECWSADPRLVWHGFNLAFRIAQYTPDHADLTSIARTASRLNVHPAVDGAFAEYESSTDYAPLYTPTAFWTQAFRRGHRPAQGAGGPWYRTEARWDSHFGGEVVARLPIEQIMSSDARQHLVDGLQRLLAWTRDTVDPPWRTAATRQIASAELYEWEAALGVAMARVVPSLDYEAAYSNVVAPMCAFDDATALRLLRWFTRAFVCRSVMDATAIAPATVQLLQNVVARVVVASDLRHTRGRDRLYGLDAPYLIDALLFLEPADASGSTRFANGDWQDVAQVVPVVDQLVRAAGTNGFVIGRYVELCKRAGGSYPADAFADQILGLADAGEFPAAWQGTSVPARIAGLIQRYAERAPRLQFSLAQSFLRILDGLIELGDRRSAALQTSPMFRHVHR
ncbi:hypothetical protein [Lysobacter humi (ex Lee et al. 2017)]